MPVGEDQTQHLELTRDIADAFNRTFKSKGALFPLPDLVSSMFYESLMKLAINVFISAIASHSLSQGSLFKNVQICARHPVSHTPH